MELPELILVQVCSYLEKRPLRLVCRRWEEVVTPLLCATLAYTPEHGASPTRLLTKYRRFIRTLELDLRGATDGHLAELDQGRFLKALGVSNLHTLVLVGATDEHVARMSPVILRLQHLHLRRMDVSGSLITQLHSPTLLTIHLEDLDYNIVHAITQRFPQITTIDYQLQGCCDKWGMVLDVARRTVSQAYVDLSHGCYTADVVFSQGSPPLYDGDPGGLQDAAGAIWRQVTLVSDLLENKDLITAMCHHNPKLAHLRLNLYGYISSDKKDLNKMLAQLQCPSLHLSTKDFRPTNKTRIMAKSLCLDFSGTVALDYMELVSTALPNLEKLSLNLNNTPSLQLAGARFPKLIDLCTQSSSPPGFLADLISLCPSLQSITADLEPMSLAIMQNSFPHIHFFSRKKSQ